jgi:hypothetical protein
MALKFNPLTGTFDFTGSGGGGGGASYIDGEVATFNDLPLDGSAPLDNAWLVREASGTWLIARKPAGIYVRTATGGTDRNADWTYAGILPDVFNDANFLLYDDADSTKNLKFQLSGITTGQTRTLTVPDANGTITLNSQLATGALDNAILRADGTSGSQTQASDIVIDDYAAATQGGTTIATRSVSFSCTATASDDFVTATGHTFANGDQVVFASLTGGGGLSTNTRYFVRDSETNKFKLATTAAGAAINITTDATAGTIQLVTALCLNPRNIGAFILGPKPDGTAVGGNARGRNAVDLQTYRADANDAAFVASGNYSVLAGNNSRTSGERSSAFGTFNTTVSGFGATSLGCFDSTVNGTLAVAIGQSVNTQNRYGIVAFGHQYFIANAILAQMTGRTTTNAAVELSAEGTATITRLTIPSGRIHHYFIIITGVRSTGATSAHYMRQYAIKNVGGTTSEVFAPVTIGTDTAASTSISITADDTNDSLKIDCTGIASETWRWHALIWCSEYAYGT